MRKICYISCKKKHAYYCVWFNFCQQNKISEFDQTPKSLFQASVIDPVTRFLVCIKESTYFCLDILSKTWQPS